ncbi:unnamed protein product, partial [Ectocarpus fasciculatus]
GRSYPFKPSKADPDTIVFHPCLAESCARFRSFGDATQDGLLGTPSLTYIDPIARFARGLVCATNLARANASRTRHPTRLDSPRFVFKTFCKPRAAATLTISACVLDT